MVNGLGERLKNQRQLLKLSQREVANTIGVSPAVVSNYENGDRSPSIETLMALAGLYKCSADYLLGISSENNLNYVDISMLSNEQKLLLQSFLDSLK